MGAGDDAGGTGSGFGADPQPVTSSAKTAKTGLDLIMLWVGRPYHAASGAPLRRPADPCGALARQACPLACVVGRTDTGGGGRRLRSSPRAGEVELVEVAEQVVVEVGREPRVGGHLVTHGAAQPRQQRERARARARGVPLRDAPLLGALVEQLGELARLAEHRAHPGVEGGAACDRDALELGAQLLEQRLARDGVLGLVGVRGVQHAELRHERLADGARGPRELGIDQRELLVRLGHVEDRAGVGVVPSIDRDQRLGEGLARGERLGQRPHGRALALEQRQVRAPGGAREQRFAPLLDEVIEGEREVR